MRIVRSAGVLVLVALAIALTGAPAASLGAPLPLGTVTLTSATDSSCPAGHSCQGIQVTCPSVQQPARGFLATAPATGAVRGLVVLATGGGGTGWWSEAGSLASSFVDGLRADGFVVVQLRWVDPWLASAPGEDAGSGHLACRPATVIKWVHDNQFVPLGLGPGAIGRCGFCISGNSGGASQVAYALSFYGLDSILDAVIPTSGPPHAAQAKGCRRNAGEEAYWYDSGASDIIDSSYGFGSGQGPCSNHDPGFVSRWNAESADTGGNDFFYPRTRVEVILGGQDTSSAPAHARDFATRPDLAGTPYLTLLVVPNMAHPIQQSQDGLAALHAAFLASAGGYPRPRGATPVRASLVPAFEQCASPNSTHGAPLSFPSCEPPQQTSSYLTVGTPDANGATANSIGSERLDIIPGDPSTPANEADVHFAISISDVRRQSDLSPYPGTLAAVNTLRITDHDPNDGVPATTQDIPFTVIVRCFLPPQTPPLHGSTCSVGTTANALVPGAVQEGKRTIWALDQVKLYDGGADGDGSTTGDNTLFETQGVFVP